MQVNLERVRELLVVLALLVDGQARPLRQTFRRRGSFNPEPRQQGVHVRLRLLRPRGAAGDVGENGQVEVRCLVRKCAEVTPLAERGHQLGWVKLAPWGAAWHGLLELACLRNFLHLTGLCANRSIIRRRDLSVIL